MCRKWEHVGVGVAAGHSETQAEWDESETYSTRVRVERQVLWSSVMQQHVAKVLPSFHDEKARKVSSGKHWQGGTGSRDGKTTHNSGASCVVFLSVHVTAFCWKPYVLCATKWVNQANISILMFLSLARKKNACRSGGELQFLTSGTSLSSQFCSQFKWRSSL